MLSVLYFFELFWLSVDTLSGYFLNNSIYLPYNQSVSSLFRLLFLVLGGYFIFVNMRSGYGFLLLLFMLFPVLFFLQMIFFDNIFFIQGFQLFVKILFFFVIYFVVKLQIDKNYLDVAMVRSVILFNSFVLFSNVFAGMAGFGFSKYSRSSVVEEGDLVQGGIGFLFSGNEVNAVFLLLYGLFLFYFYKMTFVFKWALVFVFFVVSIFSYSKTTIIGFFIISSFYVVLHRGVMKKILYAGSVVILVLVGTVDIWQAHLYNSIDRWFYFIQTYPSIISGITMGRSDRLLEALDLIYNNPLILVFGFGYMNEGYFLTTEMDLVDLSLFYGVFFSIYVYFLWFMLIKINYFQFMIHKVNIGLILPFVMLLVIFVSFIAGHVIYSSSLSLFFALALNSKTLSRRGGPRNLNNVISGNPVNPWGSIALYTGENHEQKTTQKPLTCLQG